jgi:urea transport system permease protein
VLAAGMAGLAGAIFVPVVGIISPALLGIVPSIEMVIWVALGGRTALAWAAAGAVIVNWAKSSISEQFPSTWLYLQGLLFIVVILFLPKGIAGAIEHLRGRTTLRGGRIAAAGSPSKEGV